MNSRPLSKCESQRLQQLNEAGIESALLFITETGLRKSILDATAPIRHLFQKQGWHNYETQGQGEEHKIIHRAKIFLSGKANEIDVSVYRPKTKQGDPRIWPYHLKKHANPEDVLAIFFDQNQLQIQNLSEDPFIDFLSSENDLSLLLSKRQDKYDSNAQELLKLLREIAQRGPIQADGSGDTAIGRTLETALGISMNASKKPDFKGIELKTKRNKSKTKSSLFAKVPNWKISKLKSFREMLECFGYERDGRKQIYCTVSTNKANSQGLLLKLEENLAQLQELHKFAGKENAVCVWELPTLHETLLTKHRETFWIEAKSTRKKSGKEYFEYTKAIHTRSPSIVQFDRLLSLGDITVDHLIREKGKSVHERGSLFKIKVGSRNELFLGTEKSYPLI